MNSNLIKSFRDKINDNNYFILYKYREKEGKNLWNCICACMDWIDVSINSLVNLKIKDTNINVKSMQAFSFLSSVDIVIESVIQLHRVLVDNSSEPFSKDRGIFIDKEDYVSDKQYFKQIRAIFGAHPVNLKGIDNIKWFASWPTDHVYIEYDLAVILYPSDPEIESKVFGFKFKDIWAILNKYYSYLEVLTKKIDLMYDEYCKVMRNKPIPYSESRLELIKILQLESKKRLNLEYYKSSLNDLELFYTTYSRMNSSNSKVDDFVMKLDDLLIEIYSEMQHMTFYDLKNEYLLYPEWPQEIHYYLQKAVEILRGEGYDDLLDYHLERISSFLKPIIDLKTADGEEEILLYIYTGLYYLNKD